MANPAAQEILDAHRNAGQFFTAADVGSFVRTEGTGDPVVLMHGLPASSFLYRKMLPVLAGHGLRAVAFDLPGLGLAERPPDYDYTIFGLAGFAAAAVDALGLDQFHLVVHDAGGPVGFEMARRLPGRIRSLTVLNTLVRLGSKPFPGEVVARAGRRVPSILASEPLFRQLMYLVGIADRSAVTEAELDVYRLLALGPDQGAGYLAIMRNLPKAREKSAGWEEVIDTRTAPYPVSLVWGAADPILRLRHHGWRALRASHLPALHAVPAKHYLQEDQAVPISQLVAENAARA